MQAKPPKASPPTRNRRWSQFSLRTLMIGVTAVAVAAWFVRSQANFVNERKELAREIAAQNNGDGGRVTFASELKPNWPLRAGTKIIYPPFPTVSNLRQWLGDDFALSVWLNGRRAESFLKRVKAAFPEAEIWVTFEMIKGSQRAIIGTTQLSLHTILGRRPQIVHHVTFRPLPASAIAGCNADHS